MDHGLGGFGVELVVQGNPPEVVQPGERPFDNPSQGDDTELFRAFVRPKHDLKLASERLAGYLLQLVSLVAAVGKYLLQPRELVGESPQCRFGSLAVVDVRLVDVNGHRESLRVNHDLVFPPFYLLVAVNAALIVNMLGGLDAPRVNDAEARAFLPAERDANLLSQRVHDVLEDTLALPLRKVVEHKVVGREVLGNHPPLAARLVDVEYAVHDVPERIFSLSWCRFQNFLQYLPLIIGKVSWVFSIHI